MKLNMYSIFDTATGAYMRPFFLQSDGQALRMFSDLVNDKEHEVGKHPEDYSLVRFGVWDDQNCNVSQEAVETLSTANEMVARSRNSVRVGVEENA